MTKKRHTYDKECWITTRSRKKKTTKTHNDYRDAKWLRGAAKQQQRDRISRGDNKSMIKKGKAEKKWERNRNNFCLHIDLRFMM